MKEKLLVVAVTVSVLVSAAALAAVFSARAQAADAAPSTGVALNVVTEDNVTRIYSFRSDGHLCFVASTRGGSGVSITCP